jgi:hypothetical protein
LLLTLDIRLIGLAAGITVVADARERVICAVTNSMCRAW